MSLQTCFNLLNKLQGKVEKQGTYDDILQSEIDFASILTKTDDSEKSETESTDIIRSHSEASSRTSLASFKSLENLKNDKKANEESKEDGELLQHLEEVPVKKVEGSLLVKYLLSAKRPFLLLFVIISFILAQLLASSADIYVSYWTRIEEVRTHIATNATVDNNEINQISDQSIWSTATYAYIYGSLMIALLTIAFSRSISFYHLCVSASQNLHNSMFKGLINTTMRFFDLNPSGRIMNRFSKDVGTMDEALSKSLLDATQINLMMFGAFLVTIYANIKFAILIFIMAVVSMSIKKVYLKCSTDIKHLEGISKY